MHMNVMAFQVEMDTASISIAPDWQGEGDMGLNEGIEYLHSSTAV